MKVNHSYFTEAVLEELKTKTTLVEAKTLLRGAVENSNARPVNKTKALVCIDTAKNITGLQIIAYNFYLSNGGDKVIR